MREGRGFLIHAGLDTPWMGVMGLGALPEAEGLTRLGQILEVSGALPGGLHLVVDETVPAEDPAFDGLLTAISRIPGLTVHLLEGRHVPEALHPGRVWLHGDEVPEGVPGAAWRQGRLGWVPRSKGLPGYGPADFQEGHVTPSALWGEVVMPLGALTHLDAEELGRVMGEVQGSLEQGLSQRIGAGAWPAAFPFQRRHTGWRLALVGGREFAASGGVWTEAATRLEALMETLQTRLRAPLWVVASEDVEAAAQLGHQAMREALPWRGNLPLPPAPPVFSVGLAADPRDPSPLESRLHLPSPLERLLSAPPVARLRVPAVPSEAAALAFVRAIHPVPALAWLPGSVPPPGPFLRERPWAQASAFPPVPDVTTALQPSLFQEFMEDGT